MKNKILVLSVLLMASAGAFGQRKQTATVVDSSKTKTVDQSAAIASKAKSDSLILVNKYDSLNSQLVLYKKFYKYIGDRFFPEKYKNLPIEKAIPLADSLSAARDSKFKGIETLSKTKIDSLTHLLKTLDTLRIQNQTFKALLVSLIGEEVYPLNEAELKGNWQVFVHPVKITGKGNESGVTSLEKIMLTDSLYKSSIKQIVFLEEDLADIYFFGGKKTKCFYKVIGFSREKTYTISLVKADEINIKLFVTPVPRGLQVSYKVGKAAGQYMYGYMRK